MTINHLNLPVADVRQLHDFLIKHFGFTSDSITENGKFAVLQDNAGFVIVSQQSDEPFPQDFHIGYLVSSSAIVDRKYEELKTPVLKYRHSKALNVVNIHLTHSIVKRMAY